MDKLVQFVAIVFAAFALATMVTEQTLRPAIIYLLLGTAWWLFNYTGAFTPANRHELYDWMSHPIFVPHAPRRPAVDPNRGHLAAIAGLIVLMPIHLALLH